ncbi:hypothetical protein WQQ_43630 [Hydrocarboniphaga effusa AP103]|uniref:Uncharacterized protein n=1 Tax=Hydrocarboniphaga effusa AP103 TaxID=1172194 RepID=I8T2N1_9GAMM|nr:hypothetical protein WQQ_43630 [Hydrocarboniphaga effusa AP103]
MGSRHRYGLLVGSPGPTRSRAARLGRMGVIWMRVFTAGHSTR